MKKSSIALIGFMATGKTTVGKLLVKKLGNPFEFIELDLLIEEIAGKTIPEIFSQDGEDTFRKLENEICKRVSNLKNVIISCGGGVILNEENVNNLQKNSTIVLLNSSLEAVTKRILEDGIQKRPLIDKEYPENEIKRLFLFRSPIYQSVADIIIDINNKDENLIVDEIIDLTFHK